MSRLSLLAFYVLVALSLQVDAVRDYVYQLLNRRSGFLTSPGAEQGAHVYLQGMSRFLGMQEWEVSNQPSGGAM